MRERTALVEERGYQRQVGIRAAAPRPSVSEQSFGVGVGAEIQRAGEVIQQERLETHRLERDLRENDELVRFNLDFAGLRQEMAELAREARNSDDPGHAERIREQWQSRREFALEGIESKAVRDRAQVALGEWEAQFLTREADWEFVRQQELTVDRIDQGLRISEARVKQMEDLDAYKAETGLWLAAISQLNVSDEIKAKLTDDAHQRLTIGYVQGMIDRDPELARAMVDKGAFAGVLDGRQSEALTNAADVEIRRIEAQREREAAEQRAALREQLQVFKEYEDQGLITDPKQFDDAIATAVAIGDTSLAAQLQGLQANTALVKIWGPSNATAVQRSNRMAALNAKNKKTPDELRELKFLQDKSPRWDSQEYSDPTGQAASRGGGGAPPPINYADGGTISARAKWAAARNMPVFTKSEINELRNVYASGPGGEKQVLDVLDRLGPDEAYAAAKQLDPGDPTLPVIATLPNLSRRMARAGAVKLKADPKFIKAIIEEDVDLGDAVAVLDQQFDRALVAVRADQRAAIKQTAMQILAGYADKTGVGFDEDAYAYVLHAAMGATGRGSERRGGFGAWNDKWFVLPSGVTVGEFADMTRTLIQKIEKPPVNANGKPANIWRTNVVLVRRTRTHNYYEFKDRKNRSFRNADGLVFRFKVRSQ